MNKLQAICALDRNARTYGIGMSDVSLLSAVALLSQKTGWCLACEVERMVGSRKNSYLFTRVLHLLEAVTYTNDRGNAAKKYRLNHIGVEALKKITNFREINIESLRAIDNKAKRK